MDSQFDTTTDGRMITIAAVIDCVPRNSLAAWSSLRRLLSGTPKNTNGRLTRTNLHLQAGVSRATINRVAGVLREWDAAATDKTPRDAKTAEIQANILKLRKSSARQVSARQSESSMCASIRSGGGGLSAVTATVSAVPLPELRTELGPLGLSGGIVAVANHLSTSRRETWSMARSWPVTARWDDEDLLSRLQSSSPIELWADEVEFE